MIRVLNFGAGVQSTALLFLILEGKLPPVDLVIMADTGWEPPEVYDHAARCQALCQKAGIAFEEVRLADIRQDHINRAAGLPVNSGYRVLDPAIRAMRAIPLFLLDPETGKKGMLRRSCTERYKVQPINRRLRQLLKETGQKQVEQWFGISTDEAQRERVSMQKAYVFRYPLLHELNWSRKDCIDYLTKLKIAAPKSACVGCPYRNRTQWDYIRSRPDLWADAVDFDRTIRHMPGLKSHCFIHPQRVPLDQVDWSAMKTREEHHGMNQECVGMCGV